MNKTYCNPLDLSYRYQHLKEGNKVAGFREGADPTLVYFKDKYYMFVSMSAGFFYSADLLNWNFHKDTSLQIYDYAPDVREIDGYLYFCASSRSYNCPILRSKDPLNEAFEKVSEPFPFWDPDLFLDDDGRVYFYWGCSCNEPIYGIELDKQTMIPIGEKTQLIFGNEEYIGYERPGDDGIVNKEGSVVYQSLKRFYNEETKSLEIPPEMEKASGYNAKAMTALFNSIGKPYIEGAYMNKYNGKYYLQYATPGTQFNIYSDGVYVSDKPLGPYVLQKSNPFSSKPGGFIKGAGHGSTIQDKFGNYWHASTMCISINHSFERRVGLFPAGFDSDGVMYCNQNFADYPFEIPNGKFDALNIKPKYMLLSYKKHVEASSTADGSDPSLAVNEDIKNWWGANENDSNQWLCVDLGEKKDVRAIQVNLADENLMVDFPLEEYKDDRHTRHIETNKQISSYRIEYSVDKVNWTILEEVNRECSNAYFDYPEGINARYIRVVKNNLPYNQVLRISGLRIFGNGNGKNPEKVNARANRVGDLNAKVTWDKAADAIGYNVRYGIDKDKLYMSWLVYDKCEIDLCTLIKNQEYYVCVDSFNENGITTGETFKL